MRLLRAVAVAVISTAGLFGQEKPAEPKPAALEAAIIPVKTLSGDSFNRLARMLNVFNVRYVADDKLRTIVVYASPDVVAQMRRVVDELDRPGSEAAIGRNIELSLSFLRGRISVQSKAAPLQPDLEAVARQLRTATQYKDFELWDTASLRMQEGKETTQSLRLPGALEGMTHAFATADLRLLPEAVIRKGSDRYVRFDHANINLRIPYQSGPPHAQMFNYMDVGLKTAGDFKEGQKTVLGKLSGMEDETATFVVISLKVVD